MTTPIPLDLPARPDLMFARYARRLLVTEPLRDPLPPVMVPTRVLVDGQDITALFPPTVWLRGVAAPGRNLDRHIGIDFDDVPVVSLTLSADAVHVDYKTREVWIGKGVDGITPFQVLTPALGAPFGSVRFTPTDENDRPIPSRATECTRVRIYFGSIVIAPTDGST
jgi:hypothetical protein